MNAPRNDDDAALFAPQQAVSIAISEMHAPSHQPRMRDIEAEDIAQCAAVAASTLVPPLTDLVNQISGIINTNMTLDI